MKLSKVHMASLILLASLSLVASLPPTSIRKTRIFLQPPSNLVATRKIPFGSQPLPNYCLGSTLLCSSENRNLIEEEHTIGFSQSIQIDRTPLCSIKSEYQQIDVHMSKHFGKVLVLDGCLQLTEVDGNTYNEMMAHIPMMQHPKPKRVLVIGGGDGYVVNEVLKHKSVEYVHHVELDRDVVEACKEHFPWGKTAWNDPRVSLTVADGAVFCKDFREEQGLYDIIIQDSSDPWEYDEDTGKLVPLPAAILYSHEHFANIYNMLQPESGIFSFQAESYNIPSSLKQIQEWRNQVLEIGFESVKYGTMPTVTYPTGQLGLLMCERTPSNGSTLQVIQQRFIEMIRPKEGTEKINTSSAPTFYHPRLQHSAFNLPFWVEQSIYGAASWSVDENEGKNLSDTSVSQTV